MAPVLIIPGEISFTFIKDSDMIRFVKFSVLWMFATTFCFSQEMELYMPACVTGAIEKGTRTQEGIPGDACWQNFASYSIDVDLDPVTRLLTGTEVIRYQNNSPDSLRYLVIKLLQNFYKEGVARDFGIRADIPDEGIVLEQLTVSGEVFDLNDRSHVREHGTNLYVILGKDDKLPPDTEIEISVEWYYNVPDLYVRTGAYTDSCFFIGYWFPQVAVYDDILGWDTEQYTGLQEMYNDLADFDVRITVPDPYVVWGTGELVNSHEIFTDRIRERIGRSMESGDIVQIITDEDLKEQGLLKKSGNITWHYRAKNVPDFAWAASSYYLWDATSVVVDPEKGRRTWVSTVYPSDAEGFRKSIRWAADCIEYFSTELPGVPFPYDKHVSFNGQGHSAMEFPMIANDCDHANEEYLAEIMAHEIAHCYIPFTVLSNERLHAWMDEGLVKLFGELFAETLGGNRVDFKYLNTTNIYSGYAATMYDLPLLTVSSSLDVRHNFSHSYAKAALCNLYMLEIFEEKGIGQPLRLFFERWSGKHPTPWDFFQTMNEVAGEDLSWFWEPWYFNYGYPDLAIQGVGYDENKGTTLISVENRGKLPVPVVMEITLADGSTDVIKKSPSVWRKRSGVFELHLPGKMNIAQITLGDKYIVDVHPEDNEWKADHL